MKNSRMYFKLYCIAIFFCLFLLSCGNTFNPVENFIVGYTYNVQLNVATIPASGLSNYDAVSDGKTISQSELTSGTVIVAKGSDRETSTGNLSLRFYPSTGRTENTIKIDIDGGATINGFKAQGSDYIEVPIEIRKNTLLAVVPSSFTVVTDLIQLGSITASSGGEIEITGLGITTPVRLAASGLTTYSGVNGGTYTIQAVPATGYSFSSMTIKEIDTATSSVVGTYPSPTDTYPVTLTGKNIEVDATFTLNSYNLTIPSHTGGSVLLTVDGTPTLFTPGTPVLVPYDSSVVITVSPNSGYRFASFMPAGVSGTTTGNTYNFTMPANAATVTANFTANPTITFSANPAAGGTVSATAGGLAISSGANVAPGTSVILTAATNSGYRFVNFTAGAGGAVLGTSSTYSMTMPSGNTTVTANFTNIHTMQLAAGLQSQLPSGVTIDYSTDNGVTWHMLTTTAIEIPTPTVKFRISEPNLFQVAWTGSGLSGTSDTTALITLSANITVGGTISLNNNITIANSANFILVYNVMQTNTTAYTGTITLGNNINLSGVAFNGLAHWAGEFGGTFDGNGKQIQGMNISGGSGGNMGFIRNLKSGGTVKNLTIASSCSITDSGGAVGSVVGQNYGTVENCTNEAAINGGDQTGGIVGFNRGGTVKNCSSTGVIMGSSSIGGIVGQNGFPSLYGGMVENCNNSGAVAGTGDKIGGVVGNNYGIVQNCNNTGNISGKKVGGVVGENNGSGSKVENCNNTGGTVTGTGDDAGGVAGLNSSGGTVRNCYNTMSISSSYNSVGGIVGYNSGSSSKVENSYNIGTVSGSSQAGGVLGNNSGIVTACYFLSGTSTWGIGGTPIGTSPAGSAESLISGTAVGGFGNTGSFSVWTFGSSPWKMGSSLSGVSSRPVLHGVGSEGL